MKRLWSILAVVFVVCNIALAILNFISVHGSIVWGIMDIVIAAVWLVLIVLEIKSRKKEKNK